MGSGFKVVRLFGIDISVAPSWLLIFALVTWSVATGWFNLNGWSTATLWVVSVVAALLFFASVLVHELAHSFVARAQGIPVRGITLWMLGGVSTIESEATSPGREALLAGIGPASSLALGVACWYAGHAIDTSSIARAVLIYLGFINLVLAVFNMVPGFPLDGSKVLHAALWGITHDVLKATRWAARAGVVIGALMIAYGLYSLLGRGALFSGYIGPLWFAFIGFFVFQASQMAGRQSRAESSLTGVRVGELMALPPTWIPGDITLRKAANDYFAPLGARCLPVQDDHGTLEGIDLPVRSAARRSERLGRRSGAGRDDRRRAPAHDLARRVGRDGPAPPGHDRDRAARRCPGRSLSGIHRRHEHRALHADRPGSAPRRARRRRPVGPDDPVVADRQRRSIRADPSPGAMAA